MLRFSYILGNSAIRYRIRIIWRAYDVHVKKQSLAIRGFRKGKNAIHLARVLGDQKLDYVMAAILGARYLASSVGRDEAVIRAYILNQEVEDERLDQMNL